MSKERAVGGNPSDDLDRRRTEAHERYRAARPRSEAIHREALEVLPGGNTRSVLHFEPFPFRVASAHDQVLVDVDGHRYIDLCGNYTAGLLGHSPTRIKEAVVDVLDGGWAIGATHPREVELAELICDRFPSIDQVRFTNSGTEANLMAIGTALHHVAHHGGQTDHGATERTTIGVFDHGYHGGVLAFGDLDGPHNPMNVPHRFRVGPFDDVAALDDLFQPDLACVLVEAVQGSGGCRPASPAFLHELRRRCDETGTVLIFDEVMTSRLGPGGAQQRFDVLPDMTTLGKYLAGGMTFGAFGGRRHIMAAFDPERPDALTQAGTFNNNIVSMTAAITTLRHELDADTLGEVNDRGDRLRQELQTTFEQAGAPLWVTGLGSMLCVHGDDDRLVDLYFHAMLDQGLYLARRGFMALSKAVTDDDCARLVAATRTWLADPAGFPAGGPAPDPASGGGP
ncbi:MAG: aminotransferase class III-fold pyridoxal phosphate-dependent enzyme [Acidimicrobiia bacterium]|nr:aminotransferase class III-fold pyridoxal phosphate-dependent enzyme [Acidimicrobiia bacterium]